MPRPFLFWVIFASVLPFHLSAGEDQPAEKPEASKAETGPADPTVEAEGLKPKPPQDDSRAKVEGAQAESAKEEPAAGNYILQPQDLIKIQIFQEPELNREVRLSQEGKVDMPLIRSVELKNRTLAQAEELITKRYDADYLVNPQVNITVVEYAPRRVEVFGQVATPGLVNFSREEGMTLTVAISRAGSFTRLANRKAVTLKRTLPDGETKTWVINVEQMMKGNATDTWPLQPGDVITVPERLF